MTKQQLWKQVYRDLLRKAQDHYCDGKWSQAAQACKAARYVARSYEHQHSDACQWAMVCEDHCLDREAGY